MVVARRWCWRQSDTCAAKETTTNAIITIEAHHPNGHADVENALQDMLSLLQEFVGGVYQSTIEINKPV